MDGNEGGQDNAVAAEIRQQQLLQELLQKQMDTSSGSLLSGNQTKFLQTATHQPVCNDKVKGEQTLDHFVSAQSQTYQELKRTRKRRLMDESDIEYTTGRATATTTSHSPHCGTNVGTSTSLYYTGKSKKKENPAYPAHLMPSHTYYASSELGTKGTCRGKQRPENTGDSPSTAAPAQVPIDAEVPVLPEQVILRHRLSVTEIRELPRFQDYHAGHPTRVLYVKNLHPAVSSDDLKAIFDRYPSTGDENRVRVQLMTGRMKGQAFIQFPSIEMAQQAMELANGFLVRDKPLVISYGQGKKAPVLDAESKTFANN